jgi:lactate dehydrogenase-like 2-hydroxyacid dehydrogenase
MSNLGRPKALCITTIPADLRSVLAQRCDVSDAEPLWPSEAARGVTVAATTSMYGIDAGKLDALPDVRIVICNGAGLDKIDLAAARTRNVAICNTPDELADDVGEAVIAMMYGIMRRVAEADRFVREGRWQRERIAPSRRVAGKTMGVVGLGRIGRRAAMLAAGIGMNVMYTSPKRKADVPYRYEPDLLTLAERADVLALCCTANEQTRNLVDARVLKCLGPEGYLINVARGSVVDEEALIAALTSGAIAGAALDVFASEPNLDPRFITLPNVLLSPHSASITLETRAAMLARLARDLDDFLAGRPFHDAAREAALDQKAQ